MTIDQVLADRLKKADTVALWYAVDAFDMQLREMRKMHLSPEFIAQEQARVTAAKRALRKVNKLRKSGRAGEAIAAPRSAA